ncbi:5' nucleotidase, NT5C type [Clostridium luticellarii]|jgi:uncharacterized HAD superfamily protein|uniref:Nucleotidase n=1 Tax=Clostridium luticellarii TaxID=1691940 RepID=A0A2T0BLJ0_9CLOT|nr:hypothetical protein [Clostridium luticellarii]MCI1945409.1 hypothetical protein [Clostridium luticellarii]MCI1968744.1 hypothetical protein [Clostridium luticellarii]MCI1994901.1 hypothetical protein [Clostridium luticellarii]MCI2040170.1 hypothetical protein [Clostridium luticellarii]PRR84703.1 5' nucleotidase, deoxy (Pyrimidine), cytosolic type C protein [Clostridium luticellarii]
MKSLNICIDIDGTITDPYFWLNSANKYFNKNITSDEITQYEVHKALKVSREEYTNFYNENKFDLHHRERINKDAVGTIQKLIKSSNIYFVTAREKSLEILTREYLNRNNVPYDGVYVLGTYHKVDTAKDLNCDLFIEDSFENAVELSENGFKVLLVDTNYNRFPLKENIKRVFNWTQIHNIITRILLQEKAV